MTGKTQTTGTEKTTAAKAAAKTTAAAAKQETAAAKAKRETAAANAAEKAAAAKASKEAAAAASAAASMAADDGFLGEESTVFADNEGSTAKQSDIPVEELVDGVINALGQGLGVAINATCAVANTVAKEVPPRVDLLTATAADGLGKIVSKVEQMLGRNPDVGIHGEDDIFEDDGFHEKAET